MQRRVRRDLFVLLIVIISSRVAAAENLVADPSFEVPMDKDRYGHVFARWSGWIYEGDCEFRVSDIAHSGRHSLLLVGGSQPKIRAWPAALMLDPGRYRVTAYIRGLDIGAGVWNQTTEFMFEGQYLSLDKRGTFGWTRLTFVGDVTEKGEKSFPSFGLMAPGYLWLDDVSVERVSNDVPVTPKPILGDEEQPILPPGSVTADAVRCSECGYRNMPTWGQCYACGTALRSPRPAATASPTRLLTSFEEANPFEAGEVVTEHATQGKRALRIDRGYAAMDGPQDWTGFDYLKVDVHTDATRPLDVYFEVRDTATKDYWTRVNYNTIVPPGSSTLVIPTALYVGEKSRPGRPLIQNAITRVVFSVGEQPEAPLYIDNIRLERDVETSSMLFDGLWAFDLGPAASPVMEGFSALDVGKPYTKGRGYGWKSARFWRAFDALQPDPLYQDFVCVEEGGLAVDVPNGSYHVLVNMDSPSGFWGEYQRYRQRSLILEGVEHTDTMDLAAFKQKYYRFWNSEDLPDTDTFDKYQVPYFDEKEFDVDVRDGQLNIDFRGENWGCCVSAIVIYPNDRSAEGRRFLEFVQARRRFHFDNYFKRSLHAPGEATLRPSDAERARGYILFARDWMTDVFYNDRPGDGPRVQVLTAAAFPGELEPVTFCVLPLQDLGDVRVTVSPLASENGVAMAADAVDVGYVQYRVTRVTMEGSVYTIAPRLVLPRDSVPAPRDLTRRFWLTVQVPDDTPPGLYRGKVLIAPQNGAAVHLPLELTVRRGRLDEVDVPAGPWGHTIDLPWYDDEVRQWNDAMADKSLKRLQEYGFTSCSGAPVVAYRGFENGKPVLDFTVGDRQMRRLRDHGFSMPVVNYCPFIGLDTYYQDTDRMKAAGLNDYSAFVQAIFGAIRQHAEDAGWLPVYWNLCDEPLGDNLARSTANAAAYRQAFPAGPPLFTGATSFSGSDASDPHFLLSRTLHVANWNLHDEAAVNLLHGAGGDWAFYNGGNRWTYGVYMYKAVSQFGMKFRLSWHWNVVAGDPYYALDCREDDFAWCNSSPQGELIPSVEFERIREGLDDYRYLLTLHRLAAAKGDSAALQLIQDRLAAFRLGQRDHDALFPASDWQEFRRQVAEAIERLW